MVHSEFHTSKYSGLTPYLSFFHLFIIIFFHFSSTFIWRERFWSCGDPGWERRRAHLRADGVGAFLPGVSLWCCPTTFPDLTRSAHRSSVISSTIVQSDLTTGAFRWRTKYSGWLPGPSAMLADDCFSFTALAACCTALGSAAQHLL